MRTASRRCGASHHHILAVKLLHRAPPSTISRSLLSLDWSKPAEVPTVAVPSVNQASYTVKSALINIPSFLLPKFPILLLRLSLQTAFSYDQRDWIGVLDHLCSQQDRFVLSFSHMFQNIYLFLSSFLLSCSSFPLPLWTLVCLSRLFYPMCSCHIVCSLARVLRMLQRITT